MMAVEASHLFKSYSGKTAVNDLSFSVASGEILGLIGPNGKEGRSCRACLTSVRIGSRRRVAMGAREEFSQMAVKGLGYSGAEVARYLGVTGSCVTRIVAERRLTEDVRLKYQNG
jgi:ABC-type branched-subunit amino acid transport system ATPase component